MTNQRLPIDRLKQTSLPSSADDEKTRPTAQERFTGAEMDEIREGFAKRLKTAFNHANNAEIARRCKTTDATVKFWLEGRLPSAEFFIQIHQATGVNIHWLLTGKGQRRVEFGDVFTEAEEAAINELASDRGKSFNEMVRKLATGAVELLKKL
jgi:hypothetical protein